MRALIIHYNQPERKAIDNARFAQMASALQKAGIETKVCPVNSMEQLNALLNNESPEIVYCADHHLPGKNALPVNVHAHLDRLGFPYIGSGPETLELVLSKSSLKTRWQQNGVITPGYFLVQKETAGINKVEQLIKADHFPYILKPNLEGNSRGLDSNSIVFDRESLISRLDEILQRFPEVLVEEFLGGAPDIREYTVAMIGNGTDRLLMPARITLKQKKALRVITTQDKDNHNTQAEPVIEPELNRRLQEFSSHAFDAAGVRDYARCDILMTEDRLFALEINGQPMIPDRWFEMAASGVGLNSEQYIAAIFLAGIQRYIRQGKAHLSLPDKMESFLPQEIFNKLTEDQLEFSQGISLINLTGQS